MQRKSRYLYVVIPLVLAALLMGLVLIGCEREKAAVRGVSHFEGPLDITGAGSATAPALYLAGDSNTGLYQSAADNWDITIAGTRVASFDSTGMELFGVFSATTTLTTAAQTLLGALTLGIDGTGHDVIFYGDTAGDYFHWDQSAMTLFITGTNATTALDVTDGNVVINDTLTVTAGGLVVTAGGATITAGGLTISDGDAVVADDVRVTAQTFITVTDTAAFTATGTYQAIRAAGEVTPTITVGTAGDLLVLINESAQTINIADTGIQMLSAAWAGGQYDVLVLWCDGTNWIEISRSDN